MAAVETLFPVYDPRGKQSSFDRRMQAFDATVVVQREVDEGLRVIWDDQRRKFIVIDTKAPGGPEAGYVMLVQEPDGSYRPFDQRTIDRLRELRFGHDRMKEAIAKMERERARATIDRRKGYGDKIEDAFKFLGQVITPTVSARERAKTREEIRKERHA